MLQAYLIKPYTIAEIKKAQMAYFTKQKNVLIKIKKHLIFTSAFLVGVTRLELAAPRPPV